MLTRVITYAMCKLGDIRDDKSGVTAIEYGLIAAAIAVAIIAAVFAIGDDVAAMFQDTADQLNANAPAAAP
jgi:pilus assembly protein Flp/PilA